MTVNLSTSSSPTSAEIVDDIERRMNTEIDQLVCDIRRIEPAGAPWCTFGELFVDSAVQQYYEALVNTLKSAKRRGVISFKGQMLLKGMHDDVVVSIVSKDGESNADMPALQDQGNEKTRNGGDKVYQSFSRGKSLSALNTSPYLSQTNQERFSKPSRSIHKYQSARTTWNSNNNNYNNNNNSLRKSTSWTTSSTLKGQRNTVKDKQNTPSNKNHLPTEISTPVNESKVYAIPESLNITIEEEKPASVVAIEVEMPERTFSCVQNYSPCGEFLQKSRQSTIPSSPYDYGMEGNADEACDGASVVSFATAPVTSSKSATSFTSPQVQKTVIAHSKVAGTTFRSSSIAESHADRIAREIEQLVVDVRRLGEGESSCTFGVLFDDPQVENYYEALVGTLKAARRKGVISFKGQMLLKGVHDNVRIEIVERTTV
mmetsp:Transcript_297/g.451  ORF Transcript_297/g.451 Transcript_297/m.451 type:complete len:430 (+) Transcript_297:125-1414(+)